MKRLPWFLAIAVALGAGQPAARAALPTLTVGTGAEAVDLELRELSLRVELTGGVAETVLELEFFNHTRRHQEGEFTMQLPEGATVSTYALEVAGAMRPGVSVEKEQARFAYESIKARMVDPGLVEREADNRYRTRIFPIEARSSKRVRIGYLQSLGDEPYRFALEHPRALKAFACRVTGADSAELSVADLHQTESATPGEWSWTGEDLTLAGELKIGTALPRAGEMLRRIEREPDGTVHFVAQGRLPADWQPRARPKPERVRVIWDASLSGRTRDHASELEALERYLEWAGRTEVSVQVLRHRLEAPEVFRIEEGDAAAVSAVSALLREVEFDGAADFSRIEGFEGVTLFFTDGRAGSPAWRLPAERLAEDFHFVDSLGVFGNFAGSAVGSKRLDLTGEAWFEELTRFQGGVEVAGLPRDQWQTSRLGEWWLAAGRFPADHEGGVQVRPEEGQAQRIQVGDAEAAEVEWGLARRVWAQGRLAELEVGGDAKAIIAFAQAERLVSDHTSLIVLERFADHVRYRIPPPEPELLARYEAVQQQHAAPGLEQVRIDWQGKGLWHRTDFPWVDAELVEEATAVAIWVKASRSAFPEDKLNREAVERLEEWLTSAEHVIASRKALASQADYERWNESLEGALRWLQNIRRASEVPEEGEPLHVSVRGFVRERGLYSGTAPLWLHEAIRLAGGPLQPHADRSRVYLYRDGARVGYNLESERYRPVLLRWGDMVVVEIPSRWHWGPVDPFADGFPTAGVGGRRSGGSRAGEAIFEPPGSRRHFGPRLDFAGERAEAPQAAGQPEPSLAASFSAIDPATLAAGIDAALLDDFRGSEEIAETYLRHARGPFREAAPSPATLMEIARLLFEREEPDLGERVLSNWLEWLPNQVEGTRAYAAWLAECGATGRAEELLGALLATVMDLPTQALLRYELAQFSGEADRYRAAVDAEISNRRPSTLACVALTDYFAAGGEAGGLLDGFAANAMPSDLRMVVVSSGEEVEFLVQEPWGGGFVGTSPHGGRFVKGARVHEYQIRRGLPGTYRILCRRRTGVGAGDDEEDVALPVTLRVTFHTRWGGEEQESMTRTVLMEGREITLDAVEFGWLE